MWSIAHAVGTVLGGMGINRNDYCFYAGMVSLLFKYIVFGPFQEDVKDLNKNFKTLNDNLREIRISIAELDKRVDEHDRRLDRHHERIKDLHYKMRRGSH